MTRSRSSPWMSLVLAALLAACTIARQQDTNTQIDRNIHQKEGELAQARQMQAQMQTERERLADDLRTRELGVAELKGRLQEIQRLNAASLADTQERRQQKALREKQLSEAAGQVKAVEQDTTQTPEAKARHLEAVRKQLRKTLEMLSVS